MTLSVKTQSAKRLTMLLSFAFLIFSGFAVNASAQVVISVVYANGGNGTNPTYQYDFVELFNQGTTAVDLSTYSIQYSNGTATGTLTKANLTGSIPARSYYLIRLGGPGTAGTATLPTADFLAGGISLSGTGGKILLVSDQTALSGACPTGANVVDTVGYGTTNCSETAATGAGTNVTSAQRLNNGFPDTNNNNTDFALGTPSPRNTTAGPVAASVTIGGRVTNSFNRGIAKARVMMTDEGGNQRYATTNPFGFYRFDHISAGQTVVLQVSSKQYEFPQPVQIIFVTEENANIIFSAMP
jgi:hypothetical protein